MSERPGNHTWAYTGQRGRCRDYACTDKACPATHVEVSRSGGRGLDCEFHGRQFSSPCYSCEATPWRDGSDWGRCAFVDVNGYGEPLRCALYAGHSIDHKFTCPSATPDARASCFLSYGHPGDHHVNHDGTATWVDEWIGPQARKAVWPHLRDTEPETPGTDT